MKTGCYVLEDDLILDMIFALDEIVYSYYYYIGFGFLITLAFVFAFLIISYLICLDHASEYDEKCAYFLYLLSGLFILNVLIYVYFMVTT